MSHINNRHIQQSSDQMKEEKRENEVGDPNYTQD